MSRDIMNIMNDLFIMAQDVMPVASARIVAALYRRNKLISIGSNTNKQHTFCLKWQKNPNAGSRFHAETLAIFNALKRYSEDELIDMNDTKLYIVRAKRPYAHAENFIYGNSRPCVGCSRAIKHFNISEVYYSHDEDEFGRGYGVWYPGD